jgi:glutaredoxin
MSRFAGERSALTELGEQPPRVVLYSKPGCHLCEDARAVIDTVCAELNEKYDEIDITTSADLLRRYADEIPVTSVDGKQLDFWRVDPVRLREALNRPAEPAAAPRPE